MNKKNIAFVFPGQGSQSLKMLFDWANAYPLIQTIFEQASSILKYDLWQLIQEGPKEKLDQTRYTQPALFTASYALFKVLTTNYNIRPNIMAGHSLGEYSALACAEAISFKDALQLVAKRAQLMQKAIPNNQGAMAVIIGLDHKQVSEICAQVAMTSEVSAANINSPKQTVISGYIEGVNQAMVIAKAQGAKFTKILPISIPAHCSLMKSAADNFAKVIHETLIHNPIIPVVNNVDATIYRTNNEIKIMLVKQLYSPVLWSDVVERLIQNHVKIVIECGPGDVLVGLVKRINKSIITISSSNKNKFNDQLALIGD